HFTARAVIGPWVGEVLVGAAGATATALGTARVDGLQLRDLGTANLASGLRSVDLAEGSALLAAEGI
ncbi:MAG: hypothetical protein ACKOPF_02985, partial [Candidatus Limnocylindrus sp.]